MDKAAMIEKMNDSIEMITRARDELIANGSLFEDARWRDHVAFVGYMISTNLSEEND